MTEEKSKKKKRVLTRKEAIRKGNKDFRSFTRELARKMNSLALESQKGDNKPKN